MFDCNIGILAEILEPIMGKGLIPANPATWKVRRKAIVPGFHKNWLNNMMNLFVDCNQPLLEKLHASAIEGKVLNMETEFCSISLDIIGMSIWCLLRSMLFRLDHLEWINPAE
jgi:cytochrome P450